MFIPIYSNFTQIRQNQFDSLVAQLPDEKVILVGDFNTMTNHNFIKTLKSKLFLNNPKTIISAPRTWPSILPLIRIDFGFHSKDIASADYQQLCQPRFSDHCAILHTFVF